MPKNIVGEPFSASVIAGTEKVWIRGAGGKYQVFPWNFFLSHSAEKKVGEPFCAVFQNISRNEKVYG